MMQRAEVQALDDGQQKKALGELSSQFGRQFNVSKDVEKLSPDARSQRAKRSIEILERYSNGGVIDRQIQNILIKVKRAA